MHYGQNRCGGLKDRNTSNTNSHHWLYTLHDNIHCNKSVHACDCVIHRHAHTCMHMCAYTSMHAHMPTHTHIYIYIHTHTHIYQPQNCLLPFFSGFYLSRPCYHFGTCTVVVLTVHLIDYGLKVKRMNMTADGQDV